ncbi:hypothetical protein CDS [Bradyrhizobium sp.]|jgi:hypothetical protein|nr:hypothetical protein CDS [Bradyrhizobium sp.]
MASLLEVELMLRKVIRERTRQFGFGCRPMSPRAAKRAT